MRKERRLYVYVGLSLALAIGLLGVPLVVKSGYFMHIFIMTGIFIALGLSYDLLVGHVGLVSLAHPSFFGIGAYLAAILSMRYGSPFLLNFVLGGMIGAVLAYVLSFPLFRLADASFSIGTLGFMLVTFLIARNELWLTRGPMCLPGVPRPRLALPPFLDWQVSSTTDYYYLMLGVLLIVVVISSRLTTSRPGRTFISVREDAILARAVGVDILKEKRFVFVISALIAGSVGAYYAQYTTVVCPSELGWYLTDTLLIILYTGGLGTMRGVILGGIVFTFVPELLRMAAELRLVIYGVLLIVVITYMPQGLNGVAMSLFRKLPFTDTRARNGEDEQG